MESMCRLCLIAENGEDIFDKGLDNVIKDSFGIKLQMIPNWPSHACVSCINYLNGLKDFKAKIEASQTRLHELESQQEVIIETITEIYEESLPDIYEDSISEAYEEPITEIYEEPQEEVVVSTVRRSTRSKSKQKEIPPPSPIRAKRGIKKERSPSPPIIPEEEPKASPPPKRVKQETIKKVRSPSPLPPVIPEETPKETPVRKRAQRGSKKKEPKITIEKRKLRSPSPISIDEGLSQSDDATVKSDRREENGDQSHLEELMRKLNLLHCDKCQFDANTFGDLHNHYLEKHKGPYAATCCNQKYYKRDIYHHMEYHLDENRFKCKYCQKKLKSRKQLKKHYNYSHPKPEDCLLQCETCGKNLPTNSHYKVHIKSHIPKDQREFKCSYCPLAFNAEQSLDVHVKCIHEKETTFVCEICGKGYASEVPLKMHLQLAHTERKTEECDICGQQFFNVKEHKKRIHAPQISVNCEYCGVEIAPRNYNKHVKNRHTHVQIYKCNICGKEFTRLTPYNTHMDIHAGVTHACYFCKLLTSSRGSRNRHMKNIHPKEYEEYKKNLVTQVRIAKPFEVAEENPVVSS